MASPYKQYFEEMPCYLTVQDPQLRILDTNRRFLDDFGDLVGEYCYKAYKKREEPCPNCAVMKTFQDGESYGSEEVVRTRDGTEVSVIVYTRPIRDEKGDIIAVMEMSTDITEIKMLQRQLHESQQLYRVLFEEVPCYISVQDRNLKIVQANRRFKEDFGDQVGAHCYDIYKHRREPCLVCPVAKTFQDGQSHSSEEVVTSKSGEEINVIVYTAPMRNAAGEIMEVMEMSANITDIRRLQSQLTSLGLLVGSISHGIKGQLTGLDGGIYLMNSGHAKNDPKRVTKGWTMVQRNVDRIRSMVLDILYYAKDREPQWAPVSAVDLVKELTELMEKKARDLGVDFRTEVGDGVGDFEADGKAIRSMLTNILENSFDACRTDLEKERHWVRFSVSGDSGSVIFRIEDNGMGIDQETREKVFSLFFSSKGIEGTGLGLFIANKIVTSHGGTIGVDSTPKVGTTFVVKIPESRSGGKTGRMKRFEDSKQTGTACKSCSGAPKG
jgi:PAS domain S-box-containing protein